jgi:hypothetical protein
VTVLVGLTVLVRGEKGPPRAAIVDQLSLTHPNPEFIAAARTLLQQAGYVVDYYPGEQATVPLYENLAGRHYDYVIFRSHSALIPDYRVTPNGPLVRGDLGLFTVEPVSPEQYAAEQASLRVVYGRYADSGQRYFTVGSRLVASSDGSFDGATVILMGCQGLTYPVMAQALFDKSAKEVIGWTDVVGAAHTDAATQRFLEHDLADGFTAQESVALTVQEIGDDPQFGARLTYYGARP